MGGGAGCGSDVVPNGHGQPPPQAQGALDASGLPEDMLGKAVPDAGRAVTGLPGLLSPGELEDVRPGRAARSGLRARSASQSNVRSISSWWAMPRLATCVAAAVPAGPPDGTRAARPTVVPPAPHGSFPEPSIMITYTSKVLDASRYIPVRAVLRESVSACYALTLDLLAADASFDSFDRAKALNTKASVQLDVVAADNTTQLRTISGLITEMSLAGVLPDSRFWYRLVLVPRLALLDRTKRSRVFCTDKPAKVGDIVHQVLGKAEGVEYTDDDSEMRLHSNYPDRDMIVQYRESDFAFLSRLAEDSGIFYFFEESSGTEKAEKIVFADANIAFPWLGRAASAATLRYQPSIGIADRGPAVRSAALKTRLVTNRVNIKERSYVNPAQRLEFFAEGNPNGVGLLSSVEWEDYQDATWGHKLAEIRAKEAIVDELLLEGESDCVSLAAGSVFTLTGHPDGGTNCSYIVVSAEHHAWQEVEGAEHLPKPESKGAGYWNEFTAIPTTTTFRPQRRTLWPRIAGLMRATIDGEHLEHAHMDHLGCYRIKFPFDTEERAKGRSSCPVRLVTPYGGPNEGFHFPLRPGTEVMIAFHNGDPDQPVIVGPIYDGVQKSVVTETNRTVNMISTATGIKIRMSDGTVFSDTGR